MILAPSFLLFQISADVYVQQMSKHKFGPVFLPVNPRGNSGAGGWGHRLFEVNLRWLAAAKS